MEIGVLCLCIPAEIQSHLPSVSMPKGTWGHSYPPTSGQISPPQTHTMTWTLPFFQLLKNKSIKKIWLYIICNTLNSHFIIYLFIYVFISIIQLYIHFAFNSAIWLSYNHCFKNSFLTIKPLTLNVLPLSFKVYAWNSMAFWVLVT